MGLIQEISKILFPCRGMEQVMVHDECGGWIAVVEWNCGVQLKCFKCLSVWEGFWRMNDQPKYHLEWFPKEEVDKFYGED